MRRLAAVLLAQNDAPRLLELADRLSRVPDGEVVGAMLRGTVYHNESNPQMAVASFERVLELDPDLREMPASRKLFWDQLAKDLVECGRIDDACRRLEQALTTERDAELLDLLGYTYFLQANFDEARRCYRQAMEWEPGFYRPHLNLAKLELLFRRHDEALRELNRARLLAPRHHTTLYTPGPHVSAARPERPRRRRSSGRSRRSRSCARRRPRSRGSSGPAGQAMPSDRREQIDSISHIED